MALKLSNNATSTLATSINTAVTNLSVQVADASLFPTLGAGDWFPVTVRDASGNIEVMRCTARAGAVLTVTRAQEGTTALAFAAGVRVDLRMTVAAMAALETPDAINGAAAKATPVDADKFGFWNSSGGGFVAATWAQIKAAMLTYFVTMFPRVDAVQAFTPAEQGQARANIGIKAVPLGVINGDFDFWERATSQSTGGYGSADRWWFLNVGTLSVTQQTFAVGHTDVPGGPAYFARVISSTGRCYAETRLENLHRYSGKKITLTAWVRGTVATAQIAVAQQFGIGGSTPVTVSGPVTAVSSGAFTKLQAVLDIPSIAGKTLGTNPHLAIFIDTPATGSSRQLDVAHVSISEGDASADPDPFILKESEQELALCRRYYERQNISYFAAPYRTANSAVCVPFAVRKRVTPSMTLNVVAGTFGAASPTVDGFFSTTDPLDATARYINGFTADAEL